MRQKRTIRMFLALLLKWLCVCNYIENVELSLGDLLVARATSYGTSLMSLCGAAFVATASSSSSTLVTVTQARQLRVPAEAQKMRNRELILLQVFRKISSILISSFELDCICIYYLSIDERIWGGCSWDRDSSDVWEADWNTHTHTYRTHHNWYDNYHQGKKYNGKSKQTQARRVWGNPLKNKATILICFSFTVVEHRRLGTRHPFEFGCPVPGEGLPQKDQVGWWLHWWLALWGPMAGAEV